MPQDYPSISQLAHKIAETKVTIIFAVTRDQIPIYRELSKLIEGSTVGELANDSSNIVELVKENYDVSMMLAVKITCLDLSQYIHCDPKTNPLTYQTTQFNNSSC